LQDWLTDPGSLTARLIAKSRGRFQVEVVRQAIGRPSLDECKALGISSNSLALIREVVLKGDNQPWVFARSLLPLSSLTGELRHLRKQANRPLGAFLFSQPHLLRSPIAIARISSDHAYVPAELVGSEALWGRRSVFYLRAKPLLVSEVFLPDFVAHL
jgi:chorismate--pyruvate lyase